MWRKSYAAFLRPSCCSQQSGLTFRPVVSGNSGQFRWDGALPSSLFYTSGDWPAGRRSDRAVSGPERAGSAKLISLLVVGEAWRRVVSLHVAKRAVERVSVPRRLRVFSICVGGFPCGGLGCAVGALVAELGSADWPPYEVYLSAGHIRGVDAAEAAVFVFVGSRCLRSGEPLRPLPVRRHR